MNGRRRRAESPKRGLYNAPIMFARLIAVVIDLCRFRAGPQDLPHSPPLAIAILLAQIVLAWYRAKLSGAEPEMMPAVLVSGVFTLVSVALVLSLRGLQGRYWQTLLAVVSTGLLFSLLLLPVVLLVGPLDPQAATTRTLMLSWLALSIMVWQVLVLGHIWRNALNLLFPVGVLVAIAVLLVEGVLLLGLFPGMIGAQE